MISFYHPNLNNGKKLFLRLSPTRVEWTYHINTNIENTYGGQVVQILGINYDKLTIEGRFGLEGPHGHQANGSESSDLWNYSKSSGNFSDYSIGLTQLTSYFKDYFDIASQGASTRVSGHFNQVPMSVTYTGYIDATEGNSDTPAGESTAMWSVYPTSFPSYSRAITEFAPEWRVEFEVEEADSNIDTYSVVAEMDRIREGVGYNSSNKFSDPYAQAQSTDAQGNTKLINLGFSIPSPVDGVTANFSQFLPTLGLKGLNGVIEDTSGPLTKNVSRTAAVVLKGVAG